MATEPSPERIAAINEAVTKIWPAKFPCPIDGSDDWEGAGETFFPSRTPASINFSYGIPAVAVACKKCGYMVFLASAALGLAEGEPK